MGFVVCKCGERISDTVQPNENEGEFASTLDIDEVTAYYDDYGVRVDFEPIARQMWECPKCGSLILSVNSGDVRHYRTEDGPVGLFKRHNCQGIKN